MTEAEYAILKDEIDNDPLGLGYAGLKDEPTAALLNDPGGSNETLPNASIAPGEVMDAVVANELGNVPTNELLFFLARIEKVEGTLDISDGSPFYTQISQMFSVVDAPLTRDALILLKERDASRAEILFGADVVVSYMDVGTARQVI